MAVRIIAVDDNQQFRELVKRYLNRDPEFSLVGEACDGQEGVRLTEELRPDLVLMDISMPRVNGLAATKEIKAARPETRVIILSVHKEEAYFRAAKTDNRVNPLNQTEKTPDKARGDLWEALGKPASMAVYGWIKP